MRKLGLKLYSTNDNYIDEALRLYAQDKFQYIELYVVPGSFEEFSSLWKRLRKDYKIDFVVHAPHFMDGVDLGSKDKAADNLRAYCESAKFADLLDAKYIIFHPGVESCIAETAKQLKSFNDDRILVENKPYRTILSESQICNGYSPLDIAYVMKEANVGFCLDLSHCFCAANSLSVDGYGYWREFIKLGPKMIHIVDNDYQSTVDQHLHLGQGSYDFATLSMLIDNDSLITVETAKSSQTVLDDFSEDTSFIKENFFMIEDACAQDVESIYELSNDPIVRENSFNKEQIEYQTHVQWFNNKLKDKRNAFFVLRREDGVFAGQARFDEDDNCLTISVSLAADFRGRGLGKRLIKAASDKAQMVFAKPIKAYIKKSNDSSLVGFKQAGYEFNAELDDRYEFIYRYQKD